MIKSIIFDFDGVILESARIKTEAFVEVVRDYSKDQAKAFIEYHMEHMGISRHVKFRYFIEEILKEDYSEEKEQELAHSFENIVYDRVMKCEFVPGAKEFLDRNYTNYDMFVASGTPNEEMNRIVFGRNLDKYFKGVYGTPSKKEEIIDYIVRNYGYANQEILFVGDAGTDLQAANTKGLIFVGRNTSDNSETFKTVEYRVDNLLEIESVIEEIEGI